MFFLQLAPIQLDIIMVDFWGLLKFNSL